MVRQRTEKLLLKFSHCTVMRMPTHANFGGAIVECVMFEVDLWNADSLSSASFGFLFRFQH